MLSAGERRVLEGWARRRKTSQALALRSRIVLACAAGTSVTAVAADLGVWRDTARKWRSRFLASRLEGLDDEAQRQRRKHSSGTPPARRGSRAASHGQNPKQAPQTAPGHRFRPSGWGIERCGLTLPFPVRRTNSYQAA